MRNSYVLMIAAILFAAYLWHNRTPSSGEPPPAPVKRAKEISVPVPQTASPAPQIAALADTPPSDPRPPRSARYRMVDDWVIAYGDILLGKPSTPDFPPEGYVSPPTWQKWPNNKIPYSIHVDLPNAERVLRVVEYFNAHTDLKLVPYESGEDSLVFAPFKDHCLSYLGRIGGHQPVFLDDRCSDTEITHEVMHAAGFVHEHSRPDRDRYVKVNWDNVMDEKRDQFDTVPEELAKILLNRPFDYKSAMIYHPSAFAKDRGSWTLQSVNGEKIDPPEMGLSAEDIQRIKLLHLVPPGQTKKDVLRN